MYYLYIIYSNKLSRYYVGYTSNLSKRLEEHNTKVSVYTSKAQDWILMYQEQYETREAALERERQIKRKKSKKYIESLIANVSVQNNLR